MMMIMMMTMMMMGTNKHVQTKEKAKGTPSTTSKKTYLSSLVTFERLVFFGSPSRPCRSRPTNLTHRRRPRASERTTKVEKLLVHTACRVV
jgi:hypothetical protein